MNVLQDALKVAADTLIQDLNPTSVIISGVTYTASISYAADMPMMGISEVQKTGVQLSIDDYPTAPPLETEIAELDENGSKNGNVHRVKNVTFQGVAWLCECEMRHNAHKGPFV